MHGSCCVSRGTAYKSPCFTILLQILISQIFGQICIGSGHDLTLGFDWLDGKYILNSTFDAWKYWMDEDHVNSQKENFDKHQIEVMK